jgi:hypothetical protein
LDGNDAPRKLVKLAPFRAGLPRECKVQYSRCPEQAGKRFTHVAIDSLIHLIIEKVLISNDYMNQRLNESMTT